MFYKKRLLAERLKRMLGHFPVVVVSGARQVGKSTMLEHELEGWEMVVFDPVIDVGNARSDPDLFLDNQSTPLILDEIQYAPEVVAAVKRRVDHSREPGQFVMTGSQQWSVLKTASESLAGRAVFLDLEGFSISEIGGAPQAGHWLERYLANPERFVGELLRNPSRVECGRTLFEQLWRGFLPEADSLDLDLIGDFHRAYLRTYIERDVRLLAEVGDWQQFGRFVRLASALSAREINYAQLGREIGITPQTARRWLAMLTATFQWFEIPAWHGNAVKRVAKKPKGYIADTGLTCSLQMISAPAALGGHPMSGALFETCVAAEIRKLSATLPTPPAIHHWRTTAGAEVDLILERDGRLHPVEIKLGTNPGRSDLRGIRAFRETYPDLDIAPGLVICPASRPLRLARQEYAMPWDLV